MFHIEIHGPNAMTDASWLDMQLRNKDGIKYIISVIECPLHSSPHQELKCIAKINCSKAERELATLTDILLQNDFAVTLNFTHEIITPENYKSASPLNPIKINLDAKKPSSSPMRH